MSINNSLISIYSILILAVSMFSTQTETNILYLEDLNKDYISVKSSKDYMRTSFAIYRESYNSEKQQRKIVKKNNEKTNIFKKAPDTSFVSSPTSSINYLSVDKPEKISTINNLDFITVEELRTNKKIYLASKIKYIIVKDDKGNFLKWKVNMLPIE
ncbi:MAG: hypothetical protein BM557_02175 [Flavobacterium sp. MedPE-SWcel]|uniref:hypothetical protein n=1 Tax=uncultured Flavobacterium sp. TaxID=165435 RepID=UPI000911F24E|nr:hypothetical protein [uncultured Flavobacterium sp.]OIQ22205.1 MAG: hypothetical protein BM557_02175 [Flavobacterium sp. MedPE-SWcel]